MQEHIYFLYDPPHQRIKIGVAKKLVARLHDHQRDHGRRLVVLGVMEGGTDKETEIHHQFAYLNIEYPSKRGGPPQKLKGFEWFRDDPVLREYIAQHARPWDGADTFPWDNVTPTFAMFGSPEWIGWLEEFAKQQDIGPGLLVERALAAFAQANAFRPSPARGFDQTNPWPIMIMVATFSPDASARPDADAP